MALPFPLLPARRWSLALSLAALLAGGDLAAQEEARRVAGFVGEFCVKCHRGAKPEGGLSLEALGNGDAKAVDGRTLRALRARLADGEMPPKDQRAPPAEVRNGTLQDLDRLIEAASKGTATRGPALRRLSRVEYRNTVRDLLGVDVSLTDFPSDDLGYGFDNIGEVLSVSPLLFEACLDVAERIAAAAVSIEDPTRPTVRRYEAEDMACTIDDETAGGSDRNLFTNGDVSTAVELPREGEYVVRVLAWAQQAGPDPARLEIRLDGRRVRDFEVQATAREPGSYEARATLPAGRHEVAAAFVNDFYDPKNPDPKQRDRNLIIDRVEVVGPVDARPLPPAHARWIDRAPAKGKPAARAKAVLRPLVAAAFRRPARSDEVDRLSKLVAGRLEHGDSLAAALRPALVAILVSPNFLFRVESDPKPSGAPRPLDGFEQASRLSYYLWSSMPDDALFRAAADGRLATAEGVAKEAQRMLGDPRARALATNFAAQWLELRGLDDAMPDPGLFPGADGALLASMRAETESLFADVLESGAPARRLLDADYSFVDERLARHYGLSAVSGDEFRRVALPGSVRGGLLGHASILTVTSNPTRTSPVKRGKWILENLLDAPPPPPPPGVGALDERKEAVASGSVRERFERHRKDPSCASCHARMDALGFALENYDAVGRFRTHDGAFPVDPTGTLPDGRTLANAADLRQALADDPRFLRCVLVKLFTFALGRPPSDAEAQAVDHTLAGLPADVPLRDLVLAIPALASFRMR